MKRFQSRIHMRPLTPSYLVKAEIQPFCILKSWHGNCYIYWHLEIILDFKEIIKRKTKGEMSMETYGIISLLPVLVVIVTAIISKRALEALTLGTIVASIIIAKGGWWSTFFTAVQVEIGDSAYYIIMFGMFGALIKLLDESGASVEISAIPPFSPFE